MDAAGPGRLTEGRNDGVEVALRAAGLRVTRPRLAVHRALVSMGGHHSADEVAAVLDAAEVPLPRTSVYNALEALRVAGLVMQAGAGAGAALYEAATEWHHHFVCRRCGEITDVPCIVSLGPTLQTQLPGAEIDEVIYRGLCARCREDE